MRWGALALVSALVVTGCGQEPAERPSSAQRAPSPEIDEVPADAAIAGTLHVVGDTLLAVSDADASVGSLVRSSDLGASWEPVTLPGVPADIEISDDGVQIIGEVAVVTWNGGDEIEPGGPRHGPHVWASRDGVDWTGGRLPSVGPPSYAYGPRVMVADQRLVSGVVTDLSDQSSGVELFYSDDTGASWVAAEVPDLDVGGSAWIDGIWQPDDGGLVAVVADESLEDAVWVLESDDDGETWHVGSCPEEASVEPDWCEQPEPAGSFRFGIDGVSVDGGRTWHDPAVEPVPERAEGNYPVFEGTAPLPDGGWLASVSFQVDAETEHGVLARSDDGAHWRQVVAPDPCVGDNLVPRFSTPVRLGEGMLVVHSCREVSGSAGSSTLWADLYVTGSDGAELIEVPGSRQIGGELDDAYGQPVAVGDVVVVPVPAGGDVGMLHVRP